MKCLITITMLIKDRLWPINRLTGTGLIYFLVVIIFALVYFTLWNKGSDSFLIQEEFNMFPIEELQKIAADDYFEDSSTNFSVLKAYQSATIREEANRFEARFAELASARIAATSRMDAFWQKAKSRHMRRKEEIIDGTTQNAPKPADAKAEKPLPKGGEFPTLVLQNSFSPAKPPKESNNIEIHLLGTWLFPEPANSREQFRPEPDFLGTQRKMERTSDSVGGISGYWVAISEIETVEDKNQFARDISDLTSELRTNENEMNRLKAEVRRTLEYSIKARKKRLGFFDFLYFSFGVSTTSTFGDITPNSKRVRTVVTIELLVCLIIIGNLASYAGEEFNKMFTRNLKHEKKPSPKDPSIKKRPIRP